MADKTMTEEQVVGELRDGMTIGIGGWGSRRKPMSLVRAIVRSELSDLTIVAYGGPDVGLLCRTGQARKVISGFVSLDTIPLEPHYRAARQQGTVEAEEWDEGMLLLGLMAAAWRVPFLPTRAGLGSDVPVLMERFRTVRSPYGDDGMPLGGMVGADETDGTAGVDGRAVADRSAGPGEELMAVPALRLDAALIHMNRADVAGNGQFLGPDLYMDDWFSQAAERTYLSTEKVVATDELTSEASFHTMRISRLNVAGVVEAPRGAHFTQCLPDYERDESFQQEYAATARSDEAWDAFRARYLAVPDEAAYQRAVDERPEDEEA